MATVFDRVRGRILDIGKKLGYADDPGRYILDPDLSAVEGFPRKYWIVGVNPDQTITLMDQAARDAVDAVAATAALDADRESNKARFNTEKVLKALALVIVDEINLLRAEHGFAARTSTQVIAAVETKIEGLG